MATLHGIVRFSGKVGDQIFYPRGKKVFARSTSSTHHLSENSKKSGRDFGEASRNAAYIRKAFAEMVADYGTDDLISRLTKRINAVFNTIPAEHAGQKKIADGNLKLVEDFEFNGYTSLNSRLLQQPKITLTANCEIEMKLPQTATKNFVKPINKADAFLLQVKIFNLNLMTGDFETLKVNDLKFGFDNPEFPGATLRIPIMLEGQRNVFVAVGISYLYEERRKADRRYFACQISNCWHLRNGVEVKFVAPEPPTVVKIKEEETGLSWRFENE